ncbi:MAG TPA: TRAP transporter small permease subunit [Casimicrobiaceae bacterium]|nr:TRAP transporter small permease subunit [Casimicrobiaceae bacterium]
MGAPRSSLFAGVADRLDALATGIGRVVAYFTVATVLICFLNVYLRYAVGVGFVWLQESYIWTHVAAIMFGSSYALSQGAFVRVDPFYNRLSERGKAWVDLAGTVVFLGPFMWMMGSSGWSFFLASWKMSERSAYESGLPATYLLKGTLLLFVALVALQGVAIICRCLLTLLLGRRKRAAPSVSPESF